MSAKGWKCCGCGVASADGRKPCECVTICAYLPDEKGSRVWDDCNLYDDARDARIRTLLDSLASKDTALAEIRAENERLRAALALSDQPCAYCSLPADEWNKCQHGFPGCDRSDDAMGCRELGASLRLAAAESELARVKKALEPFAVLARASDRLAAEGQRRLQPEESADLTDAEIASLVMPDEQVVMTDGRMAFGHDQHPSKPVRVTMGDLRAASRSISQDVEERA